VNFASGMLNSKGFQGGLILESINKSRMDIFIDI